MRLAALLLPLLGVAACGADRTADILELEGDGLAGAVVYDARCSSCHGPGGAGGSGPAVVAPADDAEWVDIVLFGTGTMSGLEDAITDQEVADLLAFAAAGYLETSDLCRSSGGCG